MDALIYFKSITGLVNENILALSALDTARTVKEEIINFFRNSILGGASNTLRSLHDFDGTKYIFLSENQLIHLVIFDGDCLTIKSKTVFNLKEISNLEISKNKGYPLVSFIYENEKRNFKLIGAPLLPGGNLYYDSDITKECHQMRDFIVSYLNNMQSL